MAATESGPITLNQTVIDTFEAAAPGSTLPVAGLPEPLPTNLSLLADIADGRQRIPVESEPLGQTS